MLFFLMTSLVSLPQRNAAQTYVLLKQTKMHPLIWFKFRPQKETAAPAYIYIISEKYFLNTERHTSIIT